MADMQQVAAQHNEKPFGIWAIPTGSLCGYSARRERRPACKHIKLGRAGEIRYSRSSDQNPVCKGFPV